MTISFETIEIGREAGPFKYPIKDYVQPYLAATDNHHEWYRRRSPWGPPVAPISIVSDAAIRFLRQEFSIPANPVVAEQQISFHTPLRQDRTLVGYGRFTSKRLLEDRGNLVFEVRFRDEVGLLVSRCVLTFSLPAETAKRPAPAIQKPEEGEIVSLVKTLSPDRMEHYAPDRPAELIASDCISDLMFNIFGRQWFNSGIMSLSFLDAPQPGSVIAASGRVLERTENGAFASTLYTVWCEDQEGLRLAIGTASGLVPLL